MSIFPTKILLATDGSEEAQQQSEALGRVRHPLPSRGLAHQPASRQAHPNTD